MYPDAPDATVGTGAAGIFDSLVFGIGLDQAFLLLSNQHVISIVHFRWSSLSNWKQFIAISLWLKEVFDEFFFDAGEEGEFFDGDEFVFWFAEWLTDFLK